ncbi:PLP-dependent transferase [Xylariaceae sp. FL0594]|nr:PLP-dependent transferase [Xylariaceae sp. FL0594]
MYSSPLKYRVRCQIFNKTLLRSQRLVIDRPVMVGELHRTAAANTTEKSNNPRDRTLAEEGAKVNMSKKSINLLRGWPSTSLLPAEALRAASQTALTDQHIWGPGLEYGPDPGYQPLREELARWLVAFYGEVVAIEEEEYSAAHDSDEVPGADRITITGGASQSLACLLQSFTDPARTLAVWIVAPCYFLACPIFADAGLAGRLRDVPEDDEGVDLDVLEREMCALEKAKNAEATQRRGVGSDNDIRGENEGGSGNKKIMRRPCKDPGPHRKIYRHVVYCVPSFSNPSGRTMTLARRRGLVDLARRHDALVICDDVYDMLQWQIIHQHPPESSSSSSAQARVHTSRPPGLNLDKAILPRLADIDIARGPSAFDPPGKHFGHAVSNGSFSKLVSPGVRTGWTYSTADFAFGTAQTGSTRSGGAPSQLAATIVCELLKKKKRTTPRSPVSASHHMPLTLGTTGQDEKEQDEEEEEECQLTNHINHVLRPAYARRHSLLLRSIAAELAPLGIRVREGSLCGQEDVYGGYFIWMKLPSSTSSSPSSSTTTPFPPPAVTNWKWPTAKEIADRCLADEDLRIGHGELFAVQGDSGGGDEEEEEEAQSEGMASRFDDAIRLCFAWEDEEDLVDGVRRLARVIHGMLSEGPEKWRRSEHETGAFQKIRDTGDDIDQAK